MCIRDRSSSSSSSSEAAVVTGAECTGSVGTMPRYPRHNRATTISLPHWPTAWNNISHFTQIGSHNTNKYDSFCMQSLQKRANKYLLLVTFETDDNYSIWFKMKKHYSHSTTIVKNKPAIRLTSKMNYSKTQVQGVRSMNTRNDGTMIWSRQRKQTITLHCTQWSEKVLHPCQTKTLNTLCKVNFARNTHN